VRIAGECDSITYYNHNIPFSLDKHCFFLSCCDVNYAEHTQYISSLFLIVIFDIMIMEVKQ